MSGGVSFVGGILDLVRLGGEVVELIVGGWKLVGEILEYAHEFFSKYYL